MKKTIRIPKNAENRTIKLKGKSGFSQISIVAEEGSKTTIIEDISDNANRKEVIEIIAKPNSEIRFGAVQKLPDCENIVSRKAVIHKNANVEWLEIITGSSITKSETCSELVGEGAKSSIFTVFFGNKKQQFEFVNKCVHIGKNTESDMHTSGALKDKAKALQQGFAKIEKKAYNASAHQKSKILLLSEDARALPTPKLEIDNNEVVATHQASVGQIESEKIFYLMSRGIDEREAKKLFVEGFFEQYMSRIPVSELREDVETIVAERMEDD
ncbi:hypothetical protein CMO88_03085 [Candidatus Woesearchaeota archaeon]|nr:hypothetical protein [Candidatus Woesearchaeota archaeon]|tara:strand:+ start:17997 stop:18809 length:813 start_codon:yes stop_codon:yes gene_type:complete